MLNIGSNLHQVGSSFKSVIRRSFNLDVSYLNTMAVITDQEWQGDLLIACKMDGTSVHLIDTDNWTAEDVFSIMSRTGTGALILQALIPGALFAGAAIGALSVWMSRKETGYYDSQKNLKWSGRLYRNDLKPI